MTVHSSSGPEQKAVQFLVQLYEEVGENRSKSLLGMDIGESIGLSRQESKDVIHFLKGRGLITGGDVGGMVSLTGFGIEDAKKTLNQPHQQEKETPTPKASPFSPNLPWKKVAIQIASNDSIKIKAEGTSKTFHFAAIGFTDERKGDLPDTRWLVLQDLLENNGEITDSELTVKVDLKAAIKDIRKRLKGATGIQDNPFRYDPSIPAYKAEFIALDKPLFDAIPYREETGN